MKIIVKEADDVVSHAGNALELTEKGLMANGVWNPLINTNTAQMLEVPSLPPMWQGGYYKYIDKVWSLTDTGLKAIAEVKKEAITAMRYEKEISFRISSDC